MKYKLFIVLVMIGVFSFSVLSPAGSASNISVKYKYWDNGKPEEANYHDPEGNLIGTKYYREDGSLEQLVAYDAEGHITEEAYYGADGKLRKNPVDNWAAKKSKYINGVLRGVSYYNDKGKLTERDFYSPEGSFTNRQFFGDSRAGQVEDYKPDLEQFSTAQQEIDSRLKIGAEADQFYDKDGNYKDSIMTVID